MRNMQLYNAVLSTIFKRNDVLNTWTGSKGVGEYYMKRIYQTEWKWLIIAVYA